MVASAQIAESPAPPLETGARLTTEEFERRYWASPHIKKAELIEGVVHVASPVRIEHADPHAQLVTWLGLYAARVPDLSIADNATVRIDDENQPQPDVLLRAREGGSSRIDADGYVCGAPELIVEVAHTSAALDLHKKKRLYRRAGVATYIVHDVRARRIHWFELVSGKYAECRPDADGILRSFRHPGLWLDVAAMLEGDMRSVLATLERGMRESL